MDDNKPKKTAGALDVRNIIGTLMAVYGVILVVLGIFSDSTAAKTGDVNANLWAGLALVGVAAVFLVWARLRPIVVPQDVDHDTTTSPTTTPGTPGEPPR
jgi:drug/metabolite transporter (DMT)-like permease